MRVKTQGLTGPVVKGRDKVQTGDRARSSPYISIGINIRSRHVQKI